MCRCMAGCFCVVLIGLVILCPVVALAEPVEGEPVEPEPDPNQSIWDALKSVLDFVLDLIRVVGVVVTDLVPALVRLFGSLLWS